MYTVGIRNSKNISFNLSNLSKEYVLSLDKSKITHCYKSYVRMLRNQPIDKPIKNVNNTLEYPLYDLCLFTIDVSPMSSSQYIQNYKCCHRQYGDNCLTDDDIEICQYLCD